jgi:ribosome-associated heat shock protein Hsp15
MHHANDDVSRPRIDKWLWAARFFKTRSLAREAVEGGRVKLNGDRVKPSRELKPGDELTILAGELTWVVKVEILSDRRGPASEARRLYSEDAVSLEARQRQIEARKWRAEPADTIKGRPTKRDRRLIHRFTD